MEILNKYRNQVIRLYKEELTLNEYKELYKTIQGAEEEIKAELKTKTVKILKSVCNQLGRWHDSRDKKQDLINKVYDSLESYFLIGRNVSYTVFEDTHDTAQSKLIEGTTAEDLKKFYDDRKAEQEKKKKSIENPQTLEEFRTFCQEQGKENLSQEQAERYETLKAERTLKFQKEDEERKNTVSKIEIDNVDFDLHPTKHSKTGADIFTVIMKNRVEKESFYVLRQKAKKMGGYYSRYTDSRANPPIKAGFNFDTEEQAKKFIGLTEADQDTTEQKEQHTKEVIQSTGERMRERANKMIEKAEESLNAERRTNTHRQASQAGHAEAKASAEIIFAKKLIAIADGFDNGKIKFLHALRNGKQLEQLETLLNRGFYDRLKGLNLSYTEREAEQKNPLLDVNFIEYPYPKYYIDTIKSILLPYSDTKGMKQAVKKILSGYARKTTNENQNDYIVLKGEYLIKLFKDTSLKIPDQWDRNRILDQIKDFERIQKMGLVNIDILKTAIRELISLSEGAEISQEQKNELELKQLERKFIDKKIAGFFPTPKPLIDKMFSMARVYEGETVREPSAGLGHIAQEIKTKYPNNELKLNEVNFSLCEALEKKGFNVSQGDFLEETEKADVFFMNPPFENNQDIEHVKHAYKLLNEGGRIVAIMSGNKNGSSKVITEFRDFVEDLNGYFDGNESGAFKSAFNSTGVNTTTLYIEKARTEAEPTQEETTEEPQAETIEQEHQPEPVHAEANESGQMLLF